MRRAWVLIVVPLLVAACGGQRQDAGEAAGTFRVEVVNASFPKRQHIAESVKLRLRVRNAGARAVPVSVTVRTASRSPYDSSHAFGQNVRGQDLASAGRPIWVLDEGPVGGDTAYVNTWSAGTLRGGESKLMTWRLVATRPGRYTISYSVAPGLTGKAKAARGRTGGRFVVTIDDEPVPARVGPGGAVIRSG
jgi:hypothetical protein